jgi:hypothetical protein
MMRAQTEILEIPEFIRDFCFDLFSDFRKLNIKLRVDKTIQITTSSDFEC